MKTVMLMPDLRRFCIEDKREFKGRFGKIGRWLWDKLSTPSSETIVEYNTVQVDEQHLIEQIRKQKHAIRAIFNREIEFIVAGPDVVHCVYLEECRRHPPFEFRLQVPTSLDDERRIVGILVRVVPWFDGLVLVPKGNRND